MKETNEAKANKARCLLIEALEVLTEIYDNPESDFFKEAASRNKVAISDVITNF